MKTKLVYRCSHCDHQHPRWLGQCPNCENWNTLEETEIKSKAKSANGESRLNALRVLPFTGEKFKEGELKRYSTGFSKLDNAFGGGFLDGSLILLGGSPGIGKSTLASHIAGHLSSKEKVPVMITSGEEEIGQIANRMSRLGIERSEKLFLASGLNLEEILLKIEELEPKFVIIDSVQTLGSEELSYPVGSPSLIRSLTAKFLELAKTKQMVIVLLGHVTKDGLLAGPKHMEHLVDVVVQMEKPRAEEYRVVRVIKNRFGSTQTLVVFSMNSKGLSEVLDPSSSFISQEWKERLTQEKGKVGLAASLALEGGQPFLIQVEALVGKKKMSLGKRASLGVDRNRMEMLLAVLEKTLSLNLEYSDVFLSLLGGIRVRDTGVDLALLMALCSSILDLPIATHSVYFGEVSLSGDVLKPKDLEVRMHQARNLGYTDILYTQKGFFHVRNFIQALKGGIL